MDHLDFQVFLKINLKSGWFQEFQPQFTVWCSHLTVNSQWNPLIFTPKRSFGVKTGILQHILWWCSFSCNHFAEMQPWTITKFRSCKLEWFDGPPHLCGGQMISQLWGVDHHLILWCIGVKSSWKLDFTKEKVAQKENV